MKELDFSQYNTAIIIGNGFDINLGLPTGYENFIESAQFETLINHGNQLAVHLKNNYNLRNWIDIEKELSLYSMEGATESYKKEYDDLSASLTDYINDIDYLKMKKHGAAYDLMHQIAKGKNFIILDFNYTKSIRLLLSNFGLSDERIELCHLKVHGEAEKRNIVFGVEDNAPIKPEHVFIRKAYNKSFKALNFTELYKNVSSVMFFGHSLGESDHTYFKELFQNSCLNISGTLQSTYRKNFYFFHYKEDGYYRLMQQLDTLTYTSLTTFRQYNNIEFIDVFEYEEKHS